MLIIPEALAVHMPPSVFREYVRKLAIAHESPVTIAHTQDLMSLVSFGIRAGYDLTDDELIEEGSEIVRSIPRELALRITSRVGPFYDR